MLLRDRHEIVVLEARDRIGGRAHTRDGFEAGAEWIDAEHARVLALARELGEPVVPAPAGPRRVIYRGETRTTDTLWPEAQRAEARCAEIALRAEAATVHDLVEQASEPGVGRWWLESTLRSDEGEDLNRIAVGPWRDAYALYANREGGEMSAFRLARGFTSLCEKMGVTVRLGTPVRRIEIGPAGVRLNADLEPYDRVCVTTPAGVTIEGLPARRTRMTRTLKLAFRLKEPWPEVGAGVHIEGPLQQLWPSALDPRIALAYVCGADAARWSGDPDWMEAAISALGAPVRPQAVCKLDWIADPWAGGGFPYYPQGPLETWEPLEGRVFFAGDQTARWLGFAEGALESAERAADQMR
jgi:hypothetical protein